MTSVVRVLDFDRYIALESSLGTLYARSPLNFEICKSIDREVVDMYRIFYDF